MRYSRFKKQMERETVSDASSSSSTNNSSKSRKSRVSKSQRASSSAKAVLKRRRSSEPVDQVKKEYDNQSFSQDSGNMYTNSFGSKGSENSARDIQTPEPDMTMDPRMKTEMSTPSHHHDVSNKRPQTQGYIPATPQTSLSTPNHSRYMEPLSSSPSPNNSFVDDLNLAMGTEVGDDMVESFGSYASGLGLDMDGHVANGNHLYGEVYSSFEPYQVQETWPSAQCSQALEFQHTPNLWSSQPQEIGQEFLEGSLNDPIGAKVNVKKESGWERSG